MTDVAACCIEVEIKNTYTITLGVVILADQKRRDERGNNSRDVRQDRILPVIPLRETRRYEWTDTRLMAHKAGAEYKFFDDKSDQGTLKSHDTVKMYQAVEIPSESGHRRT